MVIFGPILVVALVLRDARDIAGRSVVKMRSHHELLMRLRLHDTVPGIDRDMRNLRGFLVRVGHSLAHPLDDHPVGVAVLVDAYPSLVRHFAARFLQQVAVFGCRGKQATHARLFDQVVVVFPGLVAEDGKAKAYLSTRFSVASATVAAVLRKQRYNLGGKMDFGNAFHLFNR